MLSVSACAGQDKLPSERLQTSRLWDVDQSPRTPPQIATANGYRVLAFSDEFAHPLDARKWWHRLWYERPSDEADASQSFTADGVLHIQLKPVHGRWLSNNLVSVSPNLDAGRAFRYGYVEARIKLPPGANHWPAFWLISMPHAEDPAQPAGELDVLEGSSSHPMAVLTTLHQASDRPTDKQNLRNGIDLPMRLADDFHVFGALWLPDRVEWYVDDKKINETPAYDTTSQPMMLILGQGPGDLLGDRHAMPNDPTGEDMLVDWVRVWQSVPTPGPN